MNKKQLIVGWVIIIWLCPLFSRAATFDEMLIHKTSTIQPFLGNHYKNIEWVSHNPILLNGEEPYDEEADFRGQIDVGKVDLDGDKKDETVKVIWSGGVSDHFLTIEVYRDSEIISTIKGEFGIQSNFKIEDIDGEGKKEIIIWSGIWDPRMPGEDGVTETTYEGHSGLHRYVVATYKLIREQYYLWDIYTTKKKYEPFCKEQPQ